MRVLDEDDNEVELRDLDEGEDDDVMHVDDLEKARQKQEAEEAEKQKFLQKKTNNRKEHSDMREARPASLGQIV